MTIEKLISILNQRTGLEYSYSEDDNFYYIWVIVDDKNTEDNKAKKQYTTPQKHHSEVRN